MVNKKGKGLGRGIDAFFGDIPELEDVESKDERVQQIPLTEIRPNPYQPRRNFDPTALEELAESIKETGVLQPIIVRESSVKGYEIIAGERRFRASKLAEKETIPAIVRELDEEKMMQVAILENLQREDLTSLEEAEAYSLLMNKLGLTQEEVAKRLGKSRPYIANYLRLLGLPDEVKQLLQHNELSMGQARTLLSLKNKTKMATLAKKAIKESLTVRQLEQLVIQMNEPKKEKQVKTQEKPFYIRESEERLMDKFGTGVVIRDKKEKGKIEIEYVSTEDLTRILELLDIQLDS
ncbi:ParB/RepB/Spo0J family partition protein [Lacticigenium naphthae]|uniref:ParB/RepB/Spo0J family partition protein n=1 Tax=Lacticigenium naphthae TaxID=515351 RepID=UPI0004291755|nr:ParB/RepB/Spo0J family partition protein [Lacticigenium naphthae]